VGEEDGAAEEVEEGADERVAAEVAAGGLDGAVQKRIEGAHEVHEGHSRAAGEGFAQPHRRPELVASGGVGRDLPAEQRGLAVREEAVDERAHDEAIVRRSDGDRTEGAVAFGDENMRRRLAQRPACAAGAARARFATGERGGGCVTFVDPIDPGGDVAQPWGSNAASISSARRGLASRGASRTVTKRRKEAREVRGREAVVPRKVRLRLKGAAPLVEVNRLGGASERQRYERNGGRGGLI
jgi:hypothetical protein